MSKACLTSGDLVNFQLWTYVLRDLNNAWLLSFFIWIGLWLIQFIILRTERLARVMTISFTGFIMAFIVDYVLNLNGGPGSWYSEFILRLLEIKDG